MSKQSQGGGEEPGHQDRNAPRWSVSREEVQEAGSPFNLAPLGGRRNGSNTNRCRLRNFFFFIHRCPPPKGLNHACAHVLEENRSRIRCTLAVDPSPPSPPLTFGPSRVSNMKSFCWESWRFEWWIDENRDIIREIDFSRDQRSSMRSIYGDSSKMADFWCGWNRIRVRKFGGIVDIFSRGKVLFQILGSSESPWILILSIFISRIFIIIRECRLF